MSKTLFIIFIFFSQLQHCCSSLQNDTQVDNLKSAQIQGNPSADEISNSIAKKQANDDISYILHGKLPLETGDKSDVTLNSESGNKLLEQYRLNAFFSSTYFTVRGVLSSVRSLFYGKNHLSKKIICRLNLVREKLEDIEKELRNGTVIPISEYVSSIVELAFPDDHVYYTFAEISELYKSLLGLNKFDTLLESNFKSLYRKGKPHHKGAVLIGHYRCLGEALCFQRLTIKKAFLEYKEIKAEAFLKYKRIEAESSEIIKDRLDYFFYAPGHLHRN